MLFKKNYLAFVVGGLVTISVAIGYLKVTYKDTESPSAQASSPSNITESSSLSSKETIKEVLSASSKENDISSSTSPVVTSNPVNHQTEDDNKQLIEQIKKETTEQINKENEGKMKQAQDEAEKFKAEAERLKKEKEELNKKQISQVNANSNSKICISYGPMSIELKHKFRNILASNKIDPSAYQDRQLPQYEIFWNLGKNKLEALEKFEKQKKEGALRDDKFKLTQDNNNNWIVPATTIAGDYSVADTLAKQLSASSSKFGGVWEIREKTGGHYIIFPNVNLISEPILLTIDKDLRLNKSFC